MIIKGLRESAEQAVRATRRDVAALTSQGTQRLVYELQVHQVELEMQNESLRSSQRDLEDSQIQYQMLFDAAPVGYVMLDGRGVIVRANRAAIKLFGLTRDGLLGRPLAGFMSAEDATLLQRRQLDARTQASACCELRLRRHERDDCHVRVDISVVSNNTVDDCLVVLTDISERQRDLVALQRLNLQLATQKTEAESRHRQLETEVALRTASEAQRRTLETRLHEAKRFESLGMLAAGVAHDFNNLLVSVLGNAELLLSAANLPDACRDRASLIKRAANQASDLTRQLLQFAGCGQLSMTSVDLAELVAEDLELLGAQLPPGVQLLSEVDGDVTPISAERGQIHQVVMNLVTNAAEAVGGQGVIKVRLRRETIDATTLAEFQHHKSVSPGSFIVLRVADDGPGIDTSTLAHIFEPFFSTKLRGRGLGLASVLGIVQNHGGAVRVRAEPGRGTCFDIAFRSLDQPRRAALAPAVAPGVAHCKGSVLLIEDDAAVREVLDQLLEHLGLDVTAAAGGAQGLEIFRRAAPRFDFVVLDWIMPGVSGEQVLRELEPRLPVILLSGYGTEHISIGDRRVIHARKPITLVDLRRAVHEAIDAIDAERESSTASGT